MARSENQKLRLLYLKQFFEEKTDEQHPATRDDIEKYLKTKEIDVERKTLYSDLDVLCDFGMDVRDEDKLRNKKYYLKERDFKPSEVKMILDSVASSKFLSENKSRELMKKLGTLVNEYHRHELNRQVKVAGRVKSMNENTTNILDYIHAAIAADKTVRFKYFHYNVNKEREFTWDGHTMRLARGLWFTIIATTTSWRMWMMISGHSAWIGWQIQAEGIRNGRERNSLRLLIWGNT